MNGIRFDFMPHVFAPWNAFIHVKARKQKYFASMDSKQKPQQTRAKNGALNFFGISST